MSRTPPADDSSDAAARWHVVGAVFLGCVFLLAGSFKVVGIYDFRATVDVLLVQFLGTMGLPLPLILKLVVASIIAIEIAVGSALLLYRTRPRAPAVVACGLLLAFSATLAAMLTMDEPPSCACLGSWEILRADAHSSAGAGLARNVGLTALALWLAAGGRPHTSALVVRSRRGDHAGGFTLIETIVVVGIVVLLIAVLLPALAGAWRHGRSTRSLSSLRQSHLAVAQYAEGARGFMPYLAQPGDPDAGTLPAEDWGDDPTPSYFRGQMALWPTSLLRQGFDLSMLPEFSQPKDGPQRLSTYLWMTHAAVARPEYWVGDDPPLSMALFAGVRFDEALYPSKKGLFGDVGHLEEGSNTWDVGFCDGSAASKSLQDPPLQVDIFRNFGAQDWRVFTTPEGIRGRDY